MKTLKDLRFESPSFFTKNDREAILKFVNENEGLFTGDHMVSQKLSICHHNTWLSVHVIGAGMLNIQKFVGSGRNYTYKCGVNFLVL